MSEASVIIIILLSSITLAWIIGKYMAKIYSGIRTASDFLKPFENSILNFCKINPAAEMNWKQYLSSFLIINAVWFLWGFILLLIQGNLPLNPAHVPSMEWTLAFNSAVSFLTSTNLQHYSGETGASYFAQVAVFMFLQFVSAGASMAAGIAVLRGIKRKTTTTIGNFYNDFILSITRILLPLCIIVALLFALRGVPMTFKGVDNFTSITGRFCSCSKRPCSGISTNKRVGFKWWWIFWCE